MVENSRHHLCPSSLGGVDGSKNVKLIKDVRHRALHALFGNRLPHDQIAYLAFSMNAQVLTDEFKDRISRAVNMGEDYIYQRGVLVPNKPIK